MIGNAGLSRVSLVPGLNESPRTVTRTPCNDARCFSNSCMTCLGCSSFIWMTASSSRMSPRMKLSSTVTCIAAAEGFRLFENSGAWTR